MRTIERAARSRHERGPVMMTSGRMSVVAFLLAAVAFSGAADAAKKKGGWESRKGRLKPLNDGQKRQIDTALPARATVRPAKARRMLVFYRCEGFVHGSISFGNYALQKMGEKAGAFTADLADEYRVFTTANLARYDVILFNNTTRLKMPSEAKKAVLGFLADGKGVAGLHAGSDNFGGWPEGIAMIGGIFNGHPWGAGGTWSFKIDDPRHPLSAAFGGKGFRHKDEIYWYKPASFAGRDKLRVLVSLDFSKAGTARGKDPKSVDVPVSWLHEYKGGRVFYSNLGHRNETYSNRIILKHFLAGIQYAAGDLKADATPSSRVKGLTPALAPGR